MENESNELFANGTSPGYAEDVAAPSFGLAALVMALRRRWWFLVIGPIVAFATVWWMRRDDAPTYTSEALIQIEFQRSPLEETSRSAAFAVNMQAQMVETQMALIRSRAVLTPAVEEGGLRVAVDGATGAVEQWFSDLRIDDSNASLNADMSIGDNGVTLTEPRSEKVLARTRSRSEPVQLRGISFTVSKDAPNTERARLRVQNTADAVRALRGRLRVEPGEGVGLINIAYRSTNPEAAARVANAVALSYQRHAAAGARETAAARRQFLEGQLVKWADSLSAAQGMLTQYQESSGALEGHVDGSTLASKLMEAERDLRALQFQETTLKSVIAALRANVPGNDAIRQVVALGQTVIPASAELYTRLRQLENERSALTASRYGLTDTNQRVVVLDSLIMDARNEMRSLAEQSLAVTVQRRQVSGIEVDALRREMGKEPARLSALGEFQRRVDGIQRTFELLATRYYQAQIDEAVESGSVRIIDPAILAAAPDPKQGRFAPIIALIVGLMIGVGVALGFDAIDPAVRNAPEAERLAGVAALATIPKIDFKDNHSPGNTFLAGEHGRGGAEAFRALRTTLRFVRTQFPRVLAITSPGPSEGKSFICTNLAVSLAQQGSRVLLVDADLRRPRLHSLFDIDRAPGLSDVLVGEVDAVDTLKPHAATGITLVTCGTRTIAPSELVGSEEFHAFLEWASQRFDAVIVDTPPVLVAAEVIALSPWVDGVLITARTGTTNRFALARASEQLRRVGAPVLGVLVNGVPFAGIAGRYANYGYFSYGEYSEAAEGNGDGSATHALLRRLFPKSIKPVPVAAMTASRVLGGPRVPAESKESGDGA